MNTRSKIFVGLCFAAALAFPALADITYTQGSGTTIFDFTCFTTKHCSAHVPINSAGTEILTTTTPGSVMIRDAAGNERGANVNASNQLSVSVDGGSAFNANGRATSANSAPMVPSAAPTTWHKVSAGSGDATSVKGSAATLFSCQMGNIDSTVAFLKIYNKATAPTVGSDTPVATLVIPKAGTAADGAGSNVVFGPGGLALGTGFAAAIVVEPTVAGSTGVTAAKVVVSCQYE